MSDQLGLPGAGGAGGGRGSIRRSSNEDLQRQQGQLAQLFLAQMTQQHSQQGVAPVGGNVSPHPVAAAAAAAAGVPAFTPADAAAAMAAAQNMDLATLMQMQAMTNEQAHVQAMEAAKRQVDRKKHELQQQVQIQQQEIKRKKRAIEEQALVVQQQQARAAQIQVQHHYYPHDSGVGGAVLDASGCPLHPPSVAAVGIGVREAGLVAPQGAIPVTASTLVEGNPTMTMPTMLPSAATAVPIIPPMPAIPPVQNHQQQSQTTIARIHPSLLQHLQPLPETTAPDISHIHQQSQPSASPSQLVFDRLEAQKKHLTKVLREKEEEIAQRQAQIVGEATKYTNAPASEAKGARESAANKEMPKMKGNSSNGAQQIEQQKVQKESTQNQEAAKKKGRKRMNRKRRVKGLKKSDAEASSVASKDVSSEVLDEASAAVKVLEKAVPADVEGASFKKAMAEATATPEASPDEDTGTDTTASAQELPEEIESPKGQSAKEVKTNGGDEAIPKKTTPKMAPNARPPISGSKLKLRKRNRAKAEAKAGPALVEASVDDSPPQRLSNQGKVEDAVALPYRSRRTNKRKTIEEVKEEHSKAETKKDEKKKEEPIIPTENDYLCGRSKVAMNHPGNESLFCMSNAQAYHDGDHQAKREIVADLIDLVRSRDPPGRFLTDDDRKGEQWHIISGSDLKNRINQKLRDMMRNKGRKRAKSSGDDSGGSIRLGKEAQKEKAGESTNDEQHNESEPKKSRKRKGAATKCKQERKHDSSDIVETNEKALDSASGLVFSNRDTAVDDEKEKYDMLNSYSFLRYHINSCQRVAPEEKATSRSQKKRKRGHEESSVDVSSLAFYPEAPLGQIWLDIVDEVGDGDMAPYWKVGLESPPPLDAGGTVLGRSWIWDEGKYIDENDRSALSWGNEHNELQSATEGEGRSFKELIEAMVSDQSLKNYARSTETLADNRTLLSSTSAYVPLHLRAYCLCGVDHRIRRSEEGSSSKMVTATPMNVVQRATPATSARKRRSERQGSSVSLSNVLGELARGELNPHTLISCEAYKGGPELRFLHNDDFSGEVYPSSKPSENDSRSLSQLIKGSRLQLDQVQPFSIKVCPDAMLLADLQSHLSESEIIGFLGGRYIESERCIYVQAAFPCKSTTRNDQGFTDVEMDPVSQIIAGETIAKHGLEVVGWYHSHPSFQPDPSVTDIHNQGNYQQLFGDHGHAVQVQETDEKQVIPFVGLIVGTYDTKNPTAESVMRWFHVTPKETGNVTSSGNATGNNKRALGRDSSFVGAPSLTTDRGWLKERVYFPMALQVNHRQFRRFCNGPVGDDSQASHEMTTIGPAIRRKTDAKRFLCALSQRQVSSLSPVTDGSTSSSSMFCQPVPTPKSGVPSKMNEIVTVEGELSTQKEIESARVKLIERLENAKKASSTQPSGAIAIQHGPIDTVLVKDIADGSPILMKNILMDAKNASALEHTHPLLFNDQELAILRLVEEGDSAGDSIHAGVIWHAVEREQLAFVEDDTEIPDSTALSQTPPSSSSILDLLLKLPSTNAPDNVSHTSIDESPQDLIQDDAVLVHAIDVILSHYSTDSQRIDPFGLWNGSVDKGQVDSKSFREFFREDEANGVSSDLQRHYLETILGFSPGHGVDSIGGKMRRGHKICICLLKWARSMQLLPYQWSETGSSIDAKTTWDHEPPIPTRKPHIFFVAEVMRLLAARWREADATGLSGRRKRRIRHRPSSGTPSIDRKSPTEAESIVKSDNAKAIESASSAKPSKEAAEEEERDEDKCNDSVKARS